jgi:hypothetical protein
MTATASAKNQTEDQSAIVAPDSGVSVLTRWEALAAEIATVTQESDCKEFNYRDTAGSESARSWIWKLRKLKGRIEKARKEAKRVHLERGRAVDEAARTLEEAVSGLIEPHEKAIEAVEAEERSRIEFHRTVLDRISRLADNVTSSAEAQARLAELSTIDTTLLEEFQSAGLNRQAEAEARLRGLYESLLAQEAERAELEALKAAKAQQDAELEVLRAEKAKQDAELEALRTAEARQRGEREEREAMELKQRSPVVPLVSEGGACPMPEARVVEAPVDTSGKRDSRGINPGAGYREPVNVRPGKIGGLEVFRSDHSVSGVENLRRELISLMAGKKLREIVDLIVTNKLHEAIHVDWLKVEEMHPF